MPTNLNTITRDAVYNAPILPYSTETYTPVSNMQIMNLIEEKLKSLGMAITNQEYTASMSKEGAIKGVIGKYYVNSGDNEFGQQVMFRNSYDKSMSFAFTVGTVVWICTNGCVSGDYVYKRVHKGVYENGTTSTWRDISENVHDGFEHLCESFDTITKQMNQLKRFEIGDSDVFKILGELLFNRDAMTITQFSTVKHELYNSKNFRHLKDRGFSAYDCYNAITESLKLSHPMKYVSDHVKTHKLFEEIFGV